MKWEKPCCAKKTHKHIQVSPSGKWCLLFSIRFSFAFSLTWLAINNRCFIHELLNISILSRVVMPFFTTFLYLFNHWNELWATVNKTLAVNTVCLFCSIISCHRFTVYIEIWFDAAQRYIHTQSSMCKQMSVMHKL